MWCIYPLLNKYSSNPNYMRFGERKRKLTKQTFGKCQMVVRITNTMGVMNDKEITKSEN